MILSPSLLSSNFGNLAQELKNLEEAGLKWVHWDVMDGHFVPNITMGPPIIQRLRQESKLFFDVHLMINDPDRYLAQFVQAGADMLVVHREACTHIHRTLAEIRRLGVKCGVALNPGTPLETLDYILDDELDMVLIMSVNPGFGGQSFIPSALRKISALKEIITTRNLSTLIQVDGGVTPDNTPQLLSAGADVLVSGSAFFNFPPYATRLETFNKAAKKH